MKLYLQTRRQIIKLWSNQEDELLDTLSCPNCRDLLFTNEYGELKCLNTGCSLYNITLEDKK